jgi:hypothetical protein
MKLMSAMKIHSPDICALLLLALISIPGAARGAVDAVPGVNTLNTTRDFPKISSREQWRERAAEIREQVLVSCGLWPMPERTPLQAHIFDKADRDGYSVEKVYLQTFPGFYLAGNLYRPLGQGKGPFPAVLSPHGHWKDGRLNDTKDCSAPARCISFARQGLLAFSYDMVGYNDTHFPFASSNKSSPDAHTVFANNRTDALWNISLMGLQTWDSIRALDFLLSLPEVDRKRVACTGESGGGTQTFMLGAIDDRLAVQAPIVMVSHRMQGGCKCENAPGLRVQYSNMEIAAAAAPRPQLLVAATGDWTRATPVMEGPAIQHIYQLFNAAGKIKYIRFDFGHNYNQTTREAVYEWFGKWLLKNPAPESLKETVCQRDSDAVLRVFPDGKIPGDAITAEQLAASLRQLHRQQWAALLPPNKSGLKKFQRSVLPAWRHTLQLEELGTKAEVRFESIGATNNLLAATVKLLRPGEDSAIQATYWAPEALLADPKPKLLVLCNAEPPPLAEDGKPNLQPKGVAGACLKRGVAVLEINRFSGNEPPDQFAYYYTTYNRTKLQSQVRDLMTVCATAGSVDPRQLFGFRVILAGSGLAGLWSVLAAPAADAVVADLNGLDLTDEQTWLSPDLFCPGILNVGGVEGAALMAAPHPLWLYNTPTQFVSQALRATYAAAGAGDKLRLETRLASDEGLAEWAAQLR